LLALVALGGWEWRMRTLGLQAGDLDDGPSFWAEQRRRVDTDDVSVVILGDSRILFGTDMNRFEALTGVRPVQLALVGSNALPFLENLAGAVKFKGVAIVGIADRNYFRDGPGLGSVALERYRFESPAVRTSFVLHRALSRRVAFLDDNYRLSNLIRHLDDGWRTGAQFPVPERLWKLGTVTDQRQTYLWPRVENDPRVREHQRSTWKRAVPPIDSAAILRIVERTRIAVAAIRARGGDVVFVRPPSAPAMRIYEDATVSRAKGWDRLLAGANVRGAYLADEPDVRKLTLPEDSHLSRACATVFTDIYVRAVTTMTSGLALRSDAPPPLTAADCIEADTPQM
jgi:hypothetical protein